MTSEDKKRFESQWPAVATRLDRMMARRGVPAHRREDIVQETGLRLLRSWDRVDAARPLWPFTVTIALNLMRDQARKGLFSEVPCEVPDHKDDSDVESLGLARLEIRRAGLALSKMEPGQRNVLLAEVEPSAYHPAGSPAAVKMLRMRARRKLALLMQQVSALSVASGAAIKRAGRFGHLYPFSRASEGALTSALCGVLCVVALSGAVSLAPFSSLPDGSDALADDGGGGVIDGLVKLSGLEASIAGLNAVSEDGFRAATIGFKGDARSTSSRPDPAAREVPEHRATVEHKSSYAIPVGGKPLAHGNVHVQVFGGGHGAGAPTSMDCSEHMISPNEINATCWDREDPDRRYGVRIRHEGKTTLDDLEISGT